MNWNFINILMFFGLLQGFALTIIIHNKKLKNKNAGKYLTIMLLGLSFNLLFYFLIDVGITKKFPLLKDFYFPWALLSCVCFYLYIAFSGPFQKKITLINKLAFLPFIIFSLLHVLIKTTKNIFTEIYNSNIELIKFIYIFEEFFGIFYSLLIGYFAYKRINQIEKEIQQKYLDYNTSKLIFHRRLIKMLFVFCLIWASLYTYALLNGSSSLSIYYIIWIFITFVVHWIAWSGFIKEKSLFPVFVSDKELEINQRKAIDELRTKISIDLHDDVGSILTGLSMQSEMLKLKVDDKNKPKIAKISSLSKEAMLRMRDIVWAMDSRKNNWQSLIDRMYEFASETLEYKNINYTITIDNEIETENLNNVVRHSLYLIYKEAITNIIKHSNANTVLIEIKNRKMEIYDNGTEIYDNKAGLGLSNMKMRAKEINGDIEIDKKNGFRVTISF